MNSLSWADSSPTLIPIPIPLHSAPQQHQAQRRHDWQALACAFGLEAAAIVAVLGWWGSHVPSPVPVVATPVPLTIESVVPPEPIRPLQMPAPPPLSSVPPQVTRVRSMLSPSVVSPRAAPASPAVQTSTEPVPQVSTPTVFSSPPVATTAMPVAAPPAPAPAQPPAPPPAVDPALASYTGKVKAAVQAAVVYPPAAIALSFRGRARVEFKLRDGVPSQAHVIASSGMGLVDRAALQSVQTASYPAPPPSLQGKEETYQLWVEFNL